MASSRRALKIKTALKTAVTVVGARIPVALDAARAVTAWWRGREFARLGARNPVDPKVIVFECYAGRSYACSPRAIFEEMLDDPRYSDHELVWAFKAPVAAALAEAGCRVRGLEGFHAPGSFKGHVDLVFGEAALEQLRRCTIVPHGSPEYFRTYARARLWISNAVVPTYLRPREGQTYLQCWHGTPLKRLGCDIPAGTSNAMYSVRSIHRRYRAEGIRMSRLVSPSPFTTEKLVSAFDLDALGRRGVVIEEGYPRNDRLLRHAPEEPARIRERLGIEPHKRVLLYAPTWRDDQHVAGMGYTYEPPLDFAALRRELGDDHVVVFRAHYLIASAFDFESHAGFVVDGSAVSDINDLYLISDVLVTDYSSVFFDFSNLGRPIVFHMPDLERYEQELRGFYLSLDELPGPVVRTQPELVAAVRPSALTLDPERMRRFSERFTPLDDGFAAGRVLARLDPAPASGAQGGGSL